MTVKSFMNNTSYSKKHHHPGVYLWGFSLDPSPYTIPTGHNKFFPYYVGKVAKQNGSVYTRTLEHICSILGGNLPIFDVLNRASAPGVTMPNTGIGSIHNSYQQALKNGKELKLPNQNFPDLLHYPEGINAFYDFYNDSNIKKQIQWMIEHFCVTYFKLNVYNKKNIEDLEKVIVNIIGSSNLRATNFSNPEVMVEIISKNQATIKLEQYEDLFKVCGGGLATSRFGF